jgi:hypothetical protein
MIPLVWLSLLQLRAQPLFIIERSTNANVVHYDAQLDAAGNLDPNTPVIGYWIILAEHGQREDFSNIEKRAAYGITIMRDTAQGCFRLALAAEIARPIRVCADRGIARAEATIDGHSAILERLYIRTKGMSFWKSVEYFELFGADMQTGIRRYEKIKPR